MKKITTISVILLGSFAANAQDQPGPIIDRDFMRELLSTSAVILVIVLISSFILSIVRMSLDNKIKSKLLEKGATENVVAQLLQPFKKDSKIEPIKWFCILAGIGTGLAFINVFQPFGVHSLAIMAFSLAASFLGYYLFTKRIDK
jgi:hypothetical protein